MRNMIYNLVEEVVSYIVNQSLDVLANASEESLIKLNSKNV